MIPSILIAQVDYAKEAKKDLKVLDSLFEIAQTNFEKSKDSLKTLTEILSPNIGTYYKEVIKIKGVTDSLYNIGKTSIAFYTQKGVQKAVLNGVFILPNDYQVGVENKKEPIEETYVLFGDEKIILKDSILNNPTAYKIFADVFKSESETHFGDFWFPMDGQEIPVYAQYKKPKRKERVRELKFDRLVIDLYEGSLRDITIYLKDETGKVFIFENSNSISLLKYNKLSGINYLKHTSVQTSSNEKFIDEHYYVKVADVLQYYTGLDGNYIPNDERFSFPIITEKGKTNIDSSNRYELRQSTALNNIIDLRAYSDILGVGGTTPNGIAQFEGQADFFVAPFRLPEDLSLGLTNVYLFKKIRPYIQYSRLDEGDQFLNTEPLDNLMVETIEEPLSHLQKSYLDAGVKLDVISFKFSKNFPFETVFYGVARYQISRVRLDSVSYNYKTLGAGGGLAFEFRRFENFKFNMSTELLKYNQEDYNNIPRLEDPEPFLVLRTEAEVSYYPSKKRSNAVFMRMRVFDNQDSEVGSNFFQWQLGYRFSIGAGKIKTGK